MKRLLVVALLLVASSAWARDRAIRVVTTGNHLEGCPWTSLAGPAGAGGGLGAWGPSARSADPLVRSMALFKPSTYISGLPAWNRYAAFLRSIGGPTSEQGILGRPIDFSQVPPEFRPGGRYALVGFTGILGINSLRGLAGDTGAHGNHADAQGHYRNHLGQIVRTFTVGNRRTRQHELYESYTERAAAGHPSNDTSFAAAGSLRRGETDTFKFRSRSSQHVIVAVVPEKFGENYVLTVKDDRTGQVLARSNSFFQVNHVQLEVPRGARLSAEVRLGYSFHPLMNSYKLVVVGEKD